MTLAVTFIFSHCVCSGVLLQDFNSIKAGVYKLPWDMTTLRHKQYDPAYTVRTALNFISEASSTLQRRMRGSPDRVWLQSPMYPDYYLNTFHYQVTRCQDVASCMTFADAFNVHHGAFLAHTPYGFELVGVAWARSPGLRLTCRGYNILVGCMHNFDVN